MNASINYDLLIEVAEHLAQRGGFHFNLDQPLALWNALGRRARVLHLPDARAYLQHLHREHSEWLRLAEEITVHETAFFRHAGQFRVLSDIVLPEIVGVRAAQRSLRLWSAACATGEEPYSLAMAVSQLDLPADWQVEIIATDLSTRAIETAEMAVFDARRLRNLNPDLILRFFQLHGERYRIRDEVRKLVTFSQFNLTQNAPLPKYLRRMDIVLCENVLIYFLPEAMQRVVGHLRDALSEGGYLFLGYAETLYGMSEGFQAVSFGDAYIYRRGSVPVVTRRPSAEQTLPSRHPAVSLKRDADQFAQSIPQAPTLKPPTLALVESLIDSGELAGATRMSEKWITIEPDSIHGRFTLARLYAAQDRDVEAADHVRQLILNEPLHAGSYILLGILCYRHDEIEEAYAQFQHALYLEPNTPVAYFFLGNIYQQRGDIPHTILAYRNAIRTAMHTIPSWDSGYTPDLLIQICERNIARLEKPLVSQ